LLSQFRSFHKERPDSHCSYYISAFFGPEKQPVEDMERILERVDKNALLEHLQKMLNPRNVILECLYSGNLCEADALNFWAGAKKIVFGYAQPAAESLYARLKFVPGSSYRVLPPSTDYEIHQQSMNEDEENGAVEFCFQSNKESYIGEKLGSDEALRETAALRLLAAMLREPIFNELR
jgi:hypothetical protein